MKAVLTSELATLLGFGSGNFVVGTKGAGEDGRGEAEEQRLSVRTPGSGC